MSAPALLLTTMEPPPSAAAEFNDWADTEHLPERRAVAGIRTALRFVCQEGWPRYLALYDLADLGVLQTPAYAAISGGHLSPWSRRVLASVSGHWRFAGELVESRAPAVVTGDRPPVLALLLVRWRGARGEWGSAIDKQLRSMFEDVTGVGHIRTFGAARGETFDFVGLVESAGSLRREQLDATRFGASAHAIDLVNVYAPYWRRSE